jgi:Chromo (CHRromatin Organisation MOdifier) domain
MHKDLESSYIPSCTECLQNKSCTMKPQGPLHPLPVPNAHSSSVAMDFIGPLPMDNGFDCILTIIDCLGADIQIIPTTIHIMAEQLASIFFDKWYCKNGMPDNIISDCDKLFTSQFWKTLTKISGVKLKMSSVYHLETDGSSECSNKTINQMLRYHVHCNQKGWVRALPRIHFQIMNTVNASMKFSGFQLHLGHSTRLIPSLNRLAAILAQPAGDFIEHLQHDVEDAKDNLMLAKITQTYQQSKHCGPEPDYMINNMVMLSTKNRRQEFNKKGEKHMAKFFPRWDGPYRISDCHQSASTYTLDIKHHTYPVFYASELKPWHANDDSLFPGRTRSQPGPIVTPNGLEEFLIQDIINSQKCDHRWQFLVHWVGYGPDHDEWLSYKDIADCVALDK